MNTQKNLIIGVSLVLVFAVGLTVGSRFSTKNISLNNGSNLVQEDSFKAGWEAAKKRLSDSGLLPPMMNQEIKNLSGELINLNGNNLVMKIRPLEPLADPSLDERIVEVNSDTKYFKLEQKEMAVIQKEQEEFNKKLQEQMKATATSPASFPAMPESFIKKEASLSDLKVGQILSIATSEDVKNTKRFKVIEVIIQAEPQALPTPPIANDLPAAPLVQ